MRAGKFPMTKEGEKKLQDELKNLKTVMRPKITSAIAEARAHGDLKENAEYHAAREQQGIIEARIRDVEAKLSHSHIIDVTSIKNDGKIIFGSTVSMIDTDTDATVTYKIVGDDEANIKEFKISVNSPIARAIIGKYEGDMVEIKVPAGVKSYEIDEVKYV